MENLSDASDNDSTSSVEEIITIREIPQQSPRPMPSAMKQVVPSRGGFIREVTHSSENMPTAVPQAVPMQLCPVRENNNTVLLGKFPPIITLNVGGILHMTRLSTLLKYSDSMLAALFSGRYQVDQDKDGNYFLDSNGTVFSHILEYLRYGTLPPTNMVLPVFRESEYYGLHSLAEKLELKPEIASLQVKESHRAQFPGYSNARDEIIRNAIVNAAISKVGEVIVHAFRKEFTPRVQNFNPNHGCIVEQANVCIGPWESTASEEMLIKCLEADLMDEGYVVKPHESRRKCKYYYGQTCQKFVFKITIVFE